MNSEEMKRTITLIVLVVIFTAFIIRDGSSEDGENDSNISNSN
jgi:hypothetical protein